MTQLLPLVIGLHSTRACGKDTLFSHIRALYPSAQRAAFADALKLDLRPLIYQQFHFDILSCTNVQKELVRGILISYGMAWREIDPLHWVRKVVEQVEQDALRDIGDAPILPVITDVRFENEAQHLRDTFGDSFRLVNLTRNGAPPPTDEEEKHYRKVAAMADAHVTWGGNTEGEQREIARHLLVHQLGMEIEESVSR